METISVMQDLKACVRRSVKGKDDTRPGEHGISVMRDLKACARVTYDVDGLVQVRMNTKTGRPSP